MFDSDHINAKERLSQLKMNKKNKWRRLNLKSNNEHKKTKRNKNLKKDLCELEWK